MSYDDNTIHVETFRTRINMHTSTGSTVPNKNNG